jgi:cytochrome c-type biogenesis protein
MGGSTYALGLLAGVLTTLSPCVLPLLPIVIASAATAHRFGPLALAAGLTVSFVGIGLFIATIGFGIGLDAELFATIAGAMMIAVGVVLLSSRLQLAVAGAGTGGFAESWMARLSPEGWRGQLVIGLLLGIVWVPCVGPTLGAASLMAARGEHLGEVALVMTLFGIGAAAPLILIGSLSREALLRWRGKMLAAGSAGKVVLGIIVLLVGIGIVSGIDRRLQAWLVAASPEWLSELTTRY